MANITRRAFAAGALAVGLTPLTTRAADEDEGEFEFDGKARKNPAATAGGFKVTGTARVPAGGKVAEVVVRWQALSTTDKSMYATVTATVDTTKTPATWTAEAKGLEVGEYWVEGRLDYIAADGQRMATDSPDKRRVMVKTAGK